MLLTSLGPELHCHINKVPVCLNNLQRWLCCSIIPWPGLGCLGLTLINIVLWQRRSTVAQSCDVSFFRVPFHVCRNQGSIRNNPATQQQLHVILVLILQHTKLISSDKTHAGSFLRISSNSPQMEVAVLSVKEGYSLLAKYVFSYVICFAEGRSVACKLYVRVSLITNTECTGDMKYECIHLCFLIIFCLCLCL